MEITDGHAGNLPAGLSAGALDPRDERPDLVNAQSGRAGERAREEHSLVLPSRRGRRWTVLIKVVPRRLEDCVPHRPADYGAQRERGIVLREADESAEKVHG